MFKRTALSVLLGTALFAVTLPGVAAENGRIAFVNVAKVLEQAPLAIAANQRLEKEFEPRNRALLDARKKLNDLEDRLSREGVTMSETQLRKMEADIRNRKREIQRAQEDYRDDLNIRRNEELRKLQKQVYEAIVALAKKEKYAMVLGDGVIYAADSTDITDKVLKVLSKDYPAKGAGR